MDRSDEAIRKGKSAELFLRDEFLQEILAEMDAEAVKGLRSCDERDLVTYRARADAVEWFTEDGSGHWKMDLWKANTDQLAAAGVSLEHIEVMGVCTKDDRSRCWSYRQDGAGAGRMVAAIRLHAAPAT